MHPIDSKIKESEAHAIIRGSEDRAQGDTHFSSGRVELESFRPRDTVTLRIVRIDLSTLETLQAPTYRVVYTQQWTGLNHLTVFGQLKSLAEYCRPACPGAIGRAEYNSASPIPVSLETGTSRRFASQRRWTLGRTSRP